MREIANQINYDAQEQVHTRHEKYEQAFKTKFWNSLSLFLCLIFFSIILLYFFHFHGNDFPTCC